MRRALRNITRERFMWGYFYCWYKAQEISLATRAGIGCQAGSSPRRTRITDSEAGNRDGPRLIVGRGPSKGRSLLGRWKVYESFMKQSQMTNRGMTLVLCTPDNDLAVRNILSILKTF